ncbi:MULTISPECIES: transposase family protein [Brevibacillus]|uniref:transposase family protein n=1 Tax=Brevibacillus TaxID=55080 RepID=UPI001EE52347|nr:MULTISPECIES: transposase family protein [Brevibacillus]MCG5252493.1 transposase family protein [Brevibacillus agri]WNF05504.1 transposase [Brevibacillus borstelensis]
MLLAVNTLYRYADDLNRIERIVWVSSDRQACFVVDIYNNSYPYPRQMMDIEEGIKENTYIIEETDPWFRIVDLETMAEKEQKRWNQAMEVIHMIATSGFEPNIFLSNERAKLIKKASEQSGLSPSTIAKYLKRYWKRGKNFYALLSDLDSCGGAGKERKLIKKVGRRSKYASLHKEMVITDEVKRFFRIALDKFYYTSKPNRPSLRWAYEQMIKEYFAIEQKTESGIVIPIVEEGSAIPTFGQFRYWFNKWRDPKKEVSSREGARKFQQQYRPVLGSTQQDAYAPAAVFQIDATVLDLNVVSAYNRNQILSRPVCYLVVDSYSHLIVGLHVSLESPSWAGGAMMALLNASEDKVKFCKRFGIEIQEEEWPVSGIIPESILADRGEMLSSKALSTIEHLQIAVKNTPPFRPEWKPLVERYLGLVQQHAKPFIPGAVNKNAKERGERDTRLNASLTVEEVIKVLIKCVLHYNNHHHLSDYERDAHQIAENVPSIPIHLWNYGIQYKSGKLRRVSQDVLRFNLLPSDKATVSQKGIKWKGILYGCETALEEKWFVRARTKGSFKVDVSYDPRCVNQIYLRLGRNEYDVCYLLDSQSRYKDKSTDDIQFLLAMEQQEKAGFKGQELGQRISLAAEIEEIVNDAVQKTKAETIPQSNAKRLRDIRENRRQEKERNREQERIVLAGVTRPKVSAADTNEPEDDNEMPNHLELLRQLQQEGLHGNR